MKIKCLGWCAGLLLVFAIVSEGNAQVVCDDVFINEYVANGNIEPFATKYLANNETLIAGKASLSPGASYQLMVVKLSSTGEIIWSKLLGAGNDDIFTGIVLLKDNSYLLYGTTAAYGHTAGKVLLVHMGIDGSLLWSRQLGDASGSKDRIKALHQAGDGDLIGTFNINDSTSSSDPVVFKMGLDGTIRWAKRFNNSGDDSFTSVAENDNKIYVGGFYSGTVKAAVWSVLNSADGNVLSTQRPYYFDTSFDQEITSMEVFDNKMSFALWATKQAGTTKLATTLLIQSDMAGNKTFETKTSPIGTPATEILKRSRDGGFFLSHTGEGIGYASNITKLSPYNTIEWAALQFSQGYIDPHTPGFDITNTNGTISAGYYNNFLTGGINRMIVMRTGETGIAGGCTQKGYTFFLDTVTMKQSPTSWASVSEVTIGLNQIISLQETSFTVVKTTVCDTSYCTDITPLPPPCNKTLLVEYSGIGRSSFRDAVTVADGGKIAVGEYNYNGLITKVNNNGDVAWARNYDEFSHNMFFQRVIKSGTDHVLVFGNDAYAIDHYAYRTIKVIKLDLNGNVVFSKEISKWPYEEIADVFATPDGGFVIVSNAGYGGGTTFSDVIRFDKDINIIWKKEIVHSTAAPVFRSIYCTADAVYLGHDSYNLEKLGVQKLDYATGNDIWSKGFTLNAQSERFNRIFVQNDTVYAFLNIVEMVNYPDFNYGIVMLRLRSNGEVINSVKLINDKMVLPESYHYLDYTNPTVTFTPDSNFVMSNRVNTGGRNALNITRFDKQGTGIWSKNYTELDAHTVFNIHTQDEGLLVMGTVARPFAFDQWFTNSFLLKTDNRGEIIGTASGVCMTEVRPFSKTPVTINEVDSRVDSVVNTDFIVRPGKVIFHPISFDATLFCNQVAFCSSMNLSGPANTCNLKDTLQFYITSNKCGAVTRWSYDSLFFSLVSKKGDTLRLLPLKSGASTVSAEIESPCFVINKSLPVSVIVSASNLTIGKDTTICPGNSILLNAGAGYKSYRWNDASTDPSLKITSAGKYYVTVTDYCGGTGSDTILVTDIANSFTITGESEKCNTDTIVLTATSGLKHYQWTPAGSLHFTDNVASVYPLQTTKYYIEAETGTGCLVKDSFVVMVKKSPPVQLGNDRAICSDESVQLTAPAGFINYEWSNGAQTPTTAVADEGIYFINATYTNGCTSKDTIAIFKYPSVNPQLGADTSICANSDFKLAPGNYRKYLWNDQSSNSVLPVTKAGLYWVDVTDGNGCFGSDTIRIVNIYQKPANFLIDTLSICWGDVRTVSPSKQFLSYLWSNGLSSNTISIKETGSYYLTVKNENGCTGSDTILVSQKQTCPADIYFYNAFTPNNDGSNDLFKPVVMGNVEKYSFLIYNKYGETVFKSSDPNAGWDGIFKGIAQPSDVFVFVCRYQFRGFEEVQKKGTLVLIR